MLISHALEYRQQVLHVMYFCAYLLSTPEESKTALRSLGEAESGSGMRQAQAKTKKEHKAVRPQRQGLRQQSTK